MSLTIEERPEGTATAYQPRGAARQLWKSKAHEVIVSGPAETGKTYACLQKVDALLWKYPGSQALMVRKTYKSIVGSALQTYTRKVLPKGSPVTPFGGERPDWFDYPNGSRLHVGGMDNADKVLSSERDFVYVNQAEELTLDDWEKLTTRATGRAGNAPYAQILGDCNPGAQHHWIKVREAEGELTVLESRHEDNPVLYTADGQLTPQGILTMAVLDALTGVRKERLRYGRWVSAEGAVYQFDARLHLLDPFPIPASWRRIRVVDFGFTNPFCCQWWALDPDGRMYLYREIYHTQRTVREHAAQINRYSIGEVYEATVADHDAEDRATLASEGIVTIPAMKAVTVGIQAVERRLSKAGDGRPRLFVFRNCLVERDESLVAARKPCCTVEELDDYHWPKSQDGKPVKEQPVKVNDHGMDSLRYGVVYADQIEAVAGSKPSTSSKFGTSRPPPEVFGNRGTSPLGGRARPAPGLSGRGPSRGGIRGPRIPPEVFG